MKTTTRTAFAGIAALGAAAVILTAPTAAQAGTTSVTDYACPAGKMCLYSGYYGSGTQWVVPGCWNNAVPGWLQQVVRSVKTAGNPALLSLKADLRLHEVRSNYQGDLPSEVTRIGVFNVWVDCNKPPSSVTAGVSGSALAAPGSRPAVSIAEAAVPAQWKLHLTFPKTTDGLTACLAQVNYYNDNPQYPEVVASECRTGSNRYEHWWKIDN